MRKSDVIFVSEFRIKESIVIKIVALLVRRPLVVDGFVGLYETRVQDYGFHRPWSIKAVALWLCDYAALQAANIYLTDTEVRADRARRQKWRGLVVALPVGAPKWARAIAELPPVRADLTGNGPKRILYYGNYIPLHGLDSVVDAMNLIGPRKDIEWVFIGDGVTRMPIARRIATELRATSVLMADPVPEVELGDWIHSSDIVLGIFGGSKKAGSVVANKVWQGLSAGRPVITRRSDALKPLRPLVADLLVEVPAEDGAALAKAIMRQLAIPREGSNGVGAALEVLVEGEFKAGFERIDAYLEHFLMAHPSTGRTVRNAGS